MLKQVAFLLGSGCSRPSGQPMVADLTQEMLYREFYLMEALDEISAFHYDLDGSYPLWGTLEELQRFDPTATAEQLVPWRMPAASIQAFLRYIVELPFWTQEPNYEDVCGLLNVIAGAVRRRTNDPLINRFLKDNRIVDRLAAIEFPRNHRYFMMDLAEQLMVVDDFVGWLVAKRIRVSPHLDGYEAFAFAISGLRERGCKSHFITTNYDCNIERLLTKMKVPFHDGFPSERYLDDAGRSWRLGNHLNFFKQRSSALMKLHGSINWYRTHDTLGSSAGLFAVSDPELTPEDGFNASIRKGSCNYTSKHSPEMLRGSMSKAHVYAYGIYAQLFAAFELALSRVSLVVVAGFGWNDEGIAARLLRFANTEEKKLLILDGSQPSPAVVANKWTNSRFSVDFNVREIISIHRQHMSAMKGDELLAMISKLLD